MLLEMAKQGNKRLFYRFSNRFVVKILRGVLALKIISA